MPTITFSEAKLVKNTFNSLVTAIPMVKEVANELLRVKQDLFEWKPKSYLIRSLETIEKHLTYIIRSNDPSSIFVREYDTRLEDDTETERASCHSTSNRWWWAAWKHTQKKPSTQPRPTVHPHCHRETSSTSSRLDCRRKDYSTEKPDGGVRPIAIGNTFRRLVSSLLLSRVRYKATDLLKPLQWGVGITCGAKLIIHSARQWANTLGQSSSWAMLQLDPRNAFNNISRKAVIRETRLQLPELSRWVNFCYGTTKKPFLFMSFSRDKIRNTQGIQQEDPLGPLLFCLTINSILKEIKKITEIDLINRTNLVSFYLDDGFIIGNHHTIAKVIKLLHSPEVQSYGLYVNLGKCKI